MQRFGNKLVAGVPDGGLSNYTKLIYRGLNIEGEYPYNIMGKRPEKACAASGMRNKFRP